MGRTWNEFSNFVVGTVEFVLAEQSIAEHRHCQRQLASDAIFDISR
jgi:hypothetical protein